MLQPLHGWPAQPAHIPEPSHTPELPAGGQLAWDQPATTAAVPAVQPHAARQQQQTAAQLHHHGHSPLRPVSAERGADLLLAAALAATPAEAAAAGVTSTRLRASPATGNTEPVPFASYHSFPATLYDGTPSCRQCTTTSG